MDLPHIFSNLRFKRATIAVAVFVLFLLVVNIFVIGGDAFVRIFNSLPDAPLSISVTIFAAIIWRAMSTERQRRHHWTGLILGWALWAVAETIWLVYSLLGREIPYPSVADVFWLIGYIPMTIWLLIRVRTLPTRPTSSQRVVIAGVSAVTCLVALIFVFIPIFQDFDPQRLIESILDLVYPLASLLLLNIVWWLFFFYEKGDHGFAWRLLMVGFILMTFSDLVFAYATWQDLYYPNMKANVLSCLVVDVPYTASYLMWLLGVHALYILLHTQQSAGSPHQLRLPPRYGHILVYLKHDNTVISVSPNFSRLFDLNAVQGKSLPEVFAISDLEADAIFDKLRTEGKVADRLFRIRDHSGVLRTFSLCGVAVRGSQQEYNGADLLLRLPVEDLSFDEALDRDTRSMAGYLLNQSGSHYQAEVRAFLLDYYAFHLRALFGVLSHEGGAAAAQSLLERLSAIAAERNWSMHFNLQTVLDDVYPLPTLREALPVLLEAARRFAADATDPQIVAAQMQALHGQLDVAVHGAAAYYCQDENGVRFAERHSVK